MRADSSSVIRLMRRLFPTPARSDLTTLTLQLETSKESDISLCQKNSYSDDTLPCLQIIISGLSESGQGFLRTTNFKNTTDVKRLV